MTVVTQKRILLLLDRRFSSHKIFCYTNVETQCIASLPKNNYYEIKNN
jgi:hypothetical protein